MKKLLALLLACLMLVSVLVSCQTGGGGTGDGTGDGNTTTDGNGDNEDEITSDEETEVVTDDWGRPLVLGTVPVDTLDFSVDGAPIEFNWIAWNNDYANVDRGDYEKPADALQLALVERNMQLEEELGIVFQFDYYSCVTAQDELFKQVETDYKGNGKYELIHSYSAYTSSTLIRDYLVDLQNEDQAPYLDLSKVWWHQNFIENTQANDHLYYVIGSSNLCAYNRIMATYVNLDLYNEYVSEEDWVDLYEVVLDGDWTYDLLFKYASIWDDVDGSTTKDAGDVYGLLSNANCEAYDGFLYAFNLTLTKTESDGTHSWNIEGNTLMEDAMAKVINLYNQNGVWLIAKTPGAESGSTQQYQMFANNKAIFDIDVITRYEAQSLAFRDMKYKYGLLPLPKYDEDQAEYGSGLQDSHAWYSVPNHSKYDKNLVSATLEYLSELSYRYAYPYYFEKVMKSQYLATKENAMVFDMIVELADFDFGEQFTQMLNGAKGKLWRSVARNEGTVTAAWTTNKETLVTALQELDLWFMSK